jgi:hypothetical protein
MYKTNIIHDCSVYCSTTCFEQECRVLDLNPDEASEFIHWEGPALECDAWGCSGVIESEYGDPDAPDEDVA